MNVPSDIFDCNENRKVRKSQKNRAVPFIFLFLFLVIIFGLYFAYQYLFIRNLEKYISHARLPENVLPTAFLKYKSFFENQPNITGISFKKILKRHFRMDLPSADDAKAEIQKKLYYELIPVKFPLSMDEYRIRKEKEAQQLYPLAKNGDKVKIRSARGNYTGFFNGMGSKGASIRIDQKIISMHDLTKESKALFDPEMNAIVQKEYVVRECSRYKYKIEQFSLSVMKKELRKQGYFYHGKFYSPSEYLAALNSGKIISSPQKSSEKQPVFRKAQETEMVKLSPMKHKYILSPKYESKRAKRKTIKTIRKTEDSEESSAMSTGKTDENEDSAESSGTSTKNSSRQ